MKKYIVLIIGVLCLLLSFIWMSLSKRSTGVHLILAAIGGGLIVEGISQIRKK